MKKCRIVGLITFDECLSLSLQILSVGFGQCTCWDVHHTRIILTGVDFINGVDR